MFVVLKFLHIAAMFSATAFAVGPIVVFYLLGRRGDVGALRAAMAFDTALERTAGGFYGLGIVLGLVAAAAGSLDLTAPWLLTAYGLLVVLIVNNLVLSGRMARLKALQSSDALASATREPLLVVSLAGLGLITLALIYVMVAKPALF